MGQYVDPDKSRGLVDLTAFAFQYEMRGRRRNADRLLAPPKLSDPSRLVQRFACFTLSLRATAHYWDETVDVHPTWRTTAAVHLDQVADALPAELSKRLEPRARK
jgi:hypothetical protein